LLAAAAPLESIPEKKATAALLTTERNSRRITGYRDLWMLKAALDQTNALVQQKVT
jgi:hypothetical protein